MNCNLHNSITGQCDHVTAQCHPCDSLISPVWQFNVTCVTVQSHPRDNSMSPVWQFTASCIRDTQFCVTVSETVSDVSNLTTGFSHIIKSHEYRHSGVTMETWWNDSPIKKKYLLIYYNIIILQSSNNISGVLHFVHCCTIVPPSIIESWLRHCRTHYKTWLKQSEQSASTPPS